MKAKTKKTLTTAIGLILLILGFLFLVFPITILIALPLFVIGLLIIWSSNNSRIFKWSCTLLPIILLFPYSQIVLELYKSRQGPAANIDLIIEENFVGRIIIVNDLDCQIQHEIGKRTRIRVPEDGITHFPGKPKINHMYTRVIQQNDANQSKELNWYKLSTGEKGVTSTGSNGIIANGKQFSINVIVIGNVIPTNIGSLVKEDDIVQYIETCEN